MPLKPQAVGITSTIPVEVLIAAKITPVDLNNRFISDREPQSLLDEAEREGMPRNTCAWVKGLYATIRRSNITTVLGVVQGDCTHLQAMLESLLPELSTFIPFSFPYDKNRYLLRFEIEKIMDIFGVQWDEVRAAKKRLDFVRAQAHEIDRRTWQGDLISGQENFNVLVNCSDFKGNPDAFESELESILKTNKKPYPQGTLRLGLLGVPTIFSDLFEFLEIYGARVVFNEVPRQFAMPNYGGDVLEQYLSYTYPYSIFGRITDIAEQARLRKLDGYIHYVQSFCHHQIEDMTLKKNLALPMLTLEGDRPGPLDGRSRTRVEAFLEMLRQPGTKKKQEAWNA
jgi:benzoyl-CoA reductase/2-hydroxyglutaryl-CoA dehydratase subunit BcrC/BadD/HgdB